MSASASVLTQHEAGTTEHEWWSSPRWDGVASLDVPALTARYRRVLVVGAHPAHETLGVGGLMVDLAALELPMTVLIASSGEESQRRASERSRKAMGARRRRELERALLGFADYLDKDASQ